MFSSLTRRIGTRVIDRLDLLVELSTLGEYGVDGDGVFALETSRPGAPGLARSRGDCPQGPRVTRPCRDAAARP